MREEFGRPAGFFLGLAAGLFVFCLANLFAGGALSSAGNLFLGPILDFSSRAAEARSGETGLSIALPYYLGIGVLLYATALLLGRMTGRDSLQAVS